jgi:predicted RNA-binding Zn ribbon-like protein
MAKSKQIVSDNKLVAGWLCLNFANTADWDEDKPKEERLFCFRDLLAWSQTAKLFEAEVIQKLEAKGFLRPDVAELVLKRALRLRLALHRIFKAIAHHQSPETSDWEIFNTELAIALPQLRVLPTQNGFNWAWLKPEESLDSILWEIVWSSAQLLNHPERLERLKQCPGVHCGWLFLDLSRNRSRCWCDMQDCGNRVKVNRYHQSKRQLGKN